MADINIKFDVENSTLRTDDDSATPEFVFSTTPTVAVQLLRGSGAGWTGLPASGTAVLSIDTEWSRAVNVCARKTIAFLNAGYTLTFPDLNLNTLKMGTETDGTDFVNAFCQLKIFADGNADPVRIFTFTCYLVNIMDLGETWTAPDASPESYYLPRAEYLAGTLREGAAVAIPAGVRIVAVTFTRVQSTAPTAIVPGVMIPTGTSDIITAVVDASTITTTGFTAILSGMTPNANFKLTYFILQ
jgi:hypothetical protein